MENYEWVWCAEENSCFNNINQGHFLRYHFIILVIVIIMIIIPWGFHIDYLLGQWRGFKGWQWLTDLLSKSPWSFRILTLMLIRCWQKLGINWSTTEQGKGTKCMLVLWISQICFVVKKNWFSCLSSISFHIFKLQALQTTK